MKLEQALRDRLAELAAREDGTAPPDCAAVLDVFASVDPALLLAAIGEDMTALIVAIAPSFGPDDQGHVQMAPGMIHWSAALGAEMLKDPMQNTFRLLTAHSGGPERIPAGHALLTPVWQLVLPALSRMIADGAEINVHDTHRWVIDPLTGKPQDHISMRMYALTMHAVGIQPTAGDVAAGLGQVFSGSVLPSPTNH
ncbi:MAG: hypothetical protein ACK5NN_02200 [Sphingomonadaceae bacterium]